MGQVQKHLSQARQLEVYAAFARETERRLTACRDHQRETEARLDRHMDRLDAALQVHYTIALAIVGPGRERREARKELRRLLVRGSR